MGRGDRVSRRRVARLTRQDGLRARVMSVYRGKAGVHRWFSRQPNHVRWTQATRPNQIWVGASTDLAVSGRWWYLVVVLDQCSRRLLAWRLTATRDSRVTRVVLDAAPTASTARRRIDLSHRSRQRVSRHTRARAPGPECGALEHDAGWRAGRERPQGVVLFTRSRPTHSRPRVSVRHRAPESAAPLYPVRTTTSACVRRWDISRPLTMNEEPRRNHLSTELRQDPSACVVLKRRW